MDSPLVHHPIGGGQWTTTDQTYTLTVRVAPGRWLAPPERRLARLIKSMRRGYGFVLVSIRQGHQDKPGKDHPVT